MFIHSLHSLKEVSGVFAVTPKVTWQVVPGNIGDGRRRARVALAIEEALPAVRTRGKYDRRDRDPNVGLTFEDLAADVKALRKHLHNFGRRSIQVGGRPSLVADPWESNTFD